MGAISGPHQDYGVLPRSPAEALEPDHAPRAAHASAATGVQRPIIKLLNNRHDACFSSASSASRFCSISCKSQFDQPGPLDYATVVVIPKGEGVREIASRLEREGIIGDQRIFVASVVIYFQAQSKAEGRRICDQEARQHARSARHAGRRQGYPLHRLHPGRADQLPGCAKGSMRIPSLPGKIDLVPVRRHLAARYLPICTRHRPRRAGRADAERTAQLHGQDLAEARDRPAIQDPAGSGQPCVHRREGDRQGG